MKVLYITPGCYDKGGISRYSRYQINALREHFGTENICVLSYLGPDENSYETPFAVHWSGRNSNVYTRLKLIFISLWYVVRNRPDIIHVAHVNYAGMAVLFSIISGAKTIVNVYGLEVWTNLKRDAAYGLKHADLVISDCYATADYVHSKGLRTQESPLKVVWDCVDMDVFKPAHEYDPAFIEQYRLPDRNKNFIISTLGRMSKDAAYKGYEVLLQVFGKIHKNYPDSRLLMIGRGDLLPSLKEHAAELGIEDAVVFTGGVPEEDLPSLLSYGHLFSLVARSGHGMGEGLPLTPLEAMACGLPIIVGNQDGSREAIMEAGNGFCIDQNDHARQEQIIAGMITHPDERKRFADAALQVARDHFSYAIFSNKYLEALLQVKEGMYKKEVS